MIHYRWHPLYGRSVRRIQGERRTSGDFVHVELSPDAVTVLPAWKLDAVYCAGLKVGAPQVSLAALGSLHELLIACESRLVSADGNIVRQEMQDGSAATARTEHRVRSEAGAAPSSHEPRQLDLILDDTRLRGITLVERQAVLNKRWRGFFSKRAAWQSGRPAMTTHDTLLPAAVLQRKAVVYVRQSTPQQVQSNLESQRRQYELVEVARRRGFTDIDVIDDDLGRTASGSVERPGFDRLVAALCAGQVGAVLCLEASRLARNGRDWQTFDARSSLAACNGFSADWIGACDPMAALARTPVLPEARNVGALPAQLRRSRPRS